MFKTSKYLLLTTALIFSSCVLKSKYEQRDLDALALEKKVEALSSEIQALRKDLEDKSSTLEKLQARNDELLLLNQKLVEKNKSLATEKTEVIRKTIKLEDDLYKKETMLGEIEKTYKSLTQDLKKEIDDGNIKIQELKGMLRVDVVSEVLFKSGSDEIMDSGKKILNKVADSLSLIKDKRIEIQGHTDNQKIYGKLREKFPTNWELSTARATSVVRYLESRGVDPKLLSAAGLSSNHPIASNDTEEGRQKNRRIEIMLLPMIDETPQTN
jgi:chemotaxis protein MotB